MRDEDDFFEAVVAVGLLVGTGRRLGCVHKFSLLFYRGLKKKNACPRGNDDIGIPYLNLLQYYTK